MSRFAPPVSSCPRTFTALAALGMLTTAALLASPTVASAGQPSTGGLQTPVYYNLSDLSTDQGLRRLYRRIETAAQEVCPGYDSADLHVVDLSQECQQQAIARAVAQIGNARLAAIHARTTMRRG
jgi:UrcA family protein